MHIRIQQRQQQRRYSSQEGGILLIVLLLVILFTGLGLLAMKHTRAELSSTKAYLENLQAEALSGTAIAMAATDIRLYNDVRCAGTNIALRHIINTNMTDNVAPPWNYRFSANFQGADPPSMTCSVPAGSVPDPTDTGVYRGLAPLAQTGLIGAEARAVLTIQMDEPRDIVCPEGSSVRECGEENTYCCYRITLHSQTFFGADSATYAPVTQKSILSRGQATASASLTVTEFPRPTFGLAFR